MKVLVRSSMAPLLLIGSLAAAGADLRLVEAVAKGDKSAVSSLLKQKVDVNAAQADGASALAWASQKDDLETADLLIRAGANVNAANDLGVGPLSLACTNASAAMVEKLLKAGAKANAVRLSGETALMTCAGTGNVDAVKSLLTHGAAVNAKETRGGQTALMWAVAEQHPEVARLLIERGADVSARSKSGFTPLLFAAQQGDPNSIKILLAAGANVNQASPEYGSALVVASASGHEALAISLLDQGAEPDAADRNGYTAMHYAVLKGVTKLSGLKVELIQSYMFRPNMTKLVKALIAHKANPNVRLVRANPNLPTSNSWVVDASGATPFLLATAIHDLSLMRFLVSSGSDPRLGTTANTTPLMAAAGLGQTRDRTEAEEKSALEAVKLAVELGADVNAANSEGQTALHGAAYIGSNPIIQFLVEKGAKLDVKDAYGMTPLSIAEGMIPAALRDIDKHPKLVHKSSADLLRKLGASPLASGAERMTLPATTPSQSR